jgi:TolB-like protein/DNA-binding winged helix-turn-helix (wHTH) protein
METPATVPNVLRFGVFEVDLQSSELRKSGIKLKLQDQPLQVLIALLEKPGVVVGREELRKKLWDADTFVDFEHSLGTAINKIREALGDSAENPRFIETLPRRGYRFVAPVTTISAASPSPLDTSSANSRRSLLAPSFGRRFALVTAAVIALAALAWGIGHRVVGAGSALPPIRSIAVLPFLNLSNDPQQEFFVDGMTDELITDLAKISDLRVISRTSVMPYKPARKSLGEIARELNVDAVVEGTVLRSGNRVRVTAQLIRVPLERHLWADSYQRDLADILSLQGEVARRIASEVRVQLTPAEQTGLTTAFRANPEAYEAYVKGRFYSRQSTPAGFDSAVLNFTRAVELEPRYAQAYADLAETYCWMGALGFAPANETLPKARQAAMKALEIDDSLGQGHSSLAWVKYAFEWNFSEAEREFARSVQLTPNSSWAHLWYGMYLAQANRLDASNTEMQKARQLDPLSPIVNALAATQLLAARRYDQALEQAGKVLETDPGNGVARWLTIEAYERKNVLAKAIDSREDMSVFFGQSKQAAAQEFAPLRSAYANFGAKGYWQAKLKREESRASKNSGDPYALALLYARTGDASRAFAWLEKGYQTRAQNLTFWLRTEPAFDALRSDSRYTDLVRRIGFPPQSP